MAAHNTQATVSFDQTGASTGGDARILTISTYRPLKDQRKILDSVQYTMAIDLAWYA